MTENDYIIPFLTIMAKYNGISTQNIKKQLDFDPADGQVINNLRSNRTLESRDLATFSDRQWYITETGKQVINLSNTIKCK